MMNGKARQGGKSHTGFTLLEVMVAMAIIAITLMAVYDSQSASVSRASEAKFTIKASLLTQKKMAEIDMLDAQDITSDSGDFGDEYPGFSWKIDVEDSSIDVPEEVSTHLKQINLTISWGKDELYSYNIKQYRFSPQ
jgi:general secretion pathway protein I